MSRRFFPLSFTPEPGVVGPSLLPFFQGLSLTVTSSYAFVGGAEGIDFAPQFCVLPQEKRMDHADTEVRVWVGLSKVSRFCLIRLF